MTFSASATPGADDDVRSVQEGHGPDAGESVACRWALRCNDGRTMTHAGKVGSFATKEQAENRAAWHDWPSAPWQCGPHDVIAVTP